MRLLALLVLAFAVLTPAHASLENDCVWMGGVWAPTVWEANVWDESMCEADAPGGGIDGFLNRMGMKIGIGL